MERGELHGACKRSENAVLAGLFTVRQDGLVVEIAFGDEAGGVLAGIETGGRAITVNRSDVSMKGRPSSRCRASHRKDFGRAVGVGEDFAIVT